MCASDQVPGSSSGTKHSVKLALWLRPLQVTQSVGLHQSPGHKVLKSSSRSSLELLQVQMFCSIFKHDVPSPAGHRLVHQAATFGPSAGAAHLQDR